MQLRLGYTIEGENKAFTQTLSFNDDETETVIKNASYFSWESSDSTAQQKLKTLWQHFEVSTSLLAVAGFVCIVLHLTLSYATETIIVHDWYSTVVISYITAKITCLALLAECFLLSVYALYPLYKYIRQEKVVFVNTVKLTPQPLTEDEQQRHHILGITLPPIGYTADGHLPLQQLEDIYRNTVLEEGYGQRPSNLWMSIMNRPIAQQVVAEFCRNWHDTARLKDALPTELDDACRKAVYGVINS